MKRTALQRWIPFRLALLVAPLIAAWPQRAHAVLGDWTRVGTATAGSYSWAFASNWDLNTIAGGVGSTANFNAAFLAANTILLDGDRTIGTMNFNNNFALNLAGNSTGGILNFATVGGPAVMDFTGMATPVANNVFAPINLTNDLRVKLKGGALQTLGGTITGGSGLIIDANAAPLINTADIAINGINRYTGGTSITDSRVRTGSNWAFGTGLVTVNNGGGVYMAGGGYYTNNFTLTGLGWNETTGLLGALRLDANSVFNGTITATSTGAAPAMRLNSHSGSTNIFNGQITGNANIEFTNSSGATTFALNNSSNNWSGTTRIGRVIGSATTTLAVGTGHTTGVLAGGDVLVDAGGVLAFNRSNNMTVANNITAASTGSLAQLGVGQTTLTGNVLHTGATTVSGLNSRLIYGAGGAMTISATPGTTTLSNFADAEFNSSSPLTIGTISAARGSYVIQSGAGTLTLGGTADNNSGRLWAVTNVILGKVAASGVQSVGSPSSQYGLVLDGGTVTIGGAISGLTAPETNNQIFNQTAVRINTGTLDLNGWGEKIGVLTGSGSITNNSLAGPGTLILGAVNAAVPAVPGAGIFYDNNTVGGPTPIHAQVYSGTIADGLGQVAVTKNELGLQVLRGINSYTGATTVSAGTLAIQGTTAVAGAVNVTGGILGGNGTVGNITLSGTGIVSPGANGQDRDTVANLNATSYSQTGGDLRITYGGLGNDTLTLSGSASLSGGTVTPAFTSAPAIGTSTIIFGGLPATAAATVNIPLNSRITGGSIAAVFNDVQLTLTGASAQTHDWTAAGGTSWDPTGVLATNWTSSDTFFRNLDAVTFTNTGAGSVVIAAGGVIPSSTTINSTANYAFTGGPIGGAGGINKLGSGTATISTANTFTGDVTITDGTLVAGNAAALGDLSGQTFVSASGTLDTNNQNLGGEIINISGTGFGGNGAIINSAAGGTANGIHYLRLTGDATVGGANRWDVRQNVGNAGEFVDLAGFTLTKTGNSFVGFASDIATTGGVNVSDGNIIINGGTLSFERQTILQGTGSVTVNNGGTLGYWTVTNGSITRQNVWNGGSINNQNTASTVNSPISLTGTTTLIGGGSTIVFGGDLTGAGTAGLIKNEGSTYNFAGNVSTAGPTTVNQGTLVYGGQNTASNGTANTVNTTGAASLGTVAATFNGGTQGNLTYGGGAYTTLAGVPSLTTINNGTLTVSSRLDNTWGGKIDTFWNGGTNLINLVNQEQVATTTFARAVGSSSQYGRVIINGGNATFGATSPLNVRLVSLGNQNQNLAGANVGTLNITGGDHRLQALYTGDVDAPNNGGIINMSGGKLTFEQNGNASLQSTNNSGVAVGGVSGIRLGHWSNGSSPGSELNLSGGTIDASKVTVNVGWDGNGFLNVTGGTLKARAIIVDGSSTTALPTVNRIDLSGGGRIEIGHGGMPTTGVNSAINSGTGTWLAAESGDWTRGMSLTNGGSTTFDTGTNRVLMTGQLAGSGSLTKDGTGILVLGAPQAALALTTTAGNALVTNATGTLLPGMLIINANVPGGAYIASVTPTTTFTLNSGSGVLAGTSIAATEVLPNLQTGAVTVNAGTVRLNNMLAMGDSSSFNFAAASTLDVNGFNNTALAPAIAVRPTSIALGGAGQPGTLGGLINSSANTGGIAVDNLGTINIPTDTTIYAVGRLELGGNIAGATFNNTIAGGTNTLTKNGQGQFIWRGAAASSIGNIVVNGGHFYAEENNNNLGASTTSITANRGGMISAFQSGGITSQSKPVILNGGAVLADVTSTWSGGLTLTANSQLQRNSSNAAVLNFTGTSLDLGGFTLTRRDRGNTGAGASTVTFSNNISSGDGSLDIQAGNVAIGASSTFGGSGNLIVRTDALLSLDTTATVSKTIQLYGGSVSDATTGSRTLAVNSAGSGYLRASNTAGTVSLGTLNLLGAAGTVSSARTAGMMFGSGSGYTDAATATLATGSITLTNNSILLNNPNFTVSSNPGLNANNDTVFARWDGTRVTGIQPTSTNAFTGSGFFSAATPAPVGRTTTLDNFVAEQTITLSAATDVLALNNGGVILREAAAGGWTGAGSVTSARKDGILGLTLANRFSGSNGLGGADVGSFAVGNISNNVFSGGALPGPLAFRPVALVVNGFGNSGLSGISHQQYTSGTYMNGGRFEPTTPNAIGLGTAWVREGGSLLFNGTYGISNNMSLKGLGINEGGGTFGAIRLGGGSGSPSATGSISLDSAVTRIHSSDAGSILGDITGNNSLQRTGGGTVIVRSALNYKGATQLGTDGAGTPMGTHTVFNLADGGVASGLGASTNAASNLVFQSGTLNYIGGAASTNRLFTVAPTMTNSASALTIANNGYGNLAFSNSGAIVMDNGAVDATLTLTANNYTANTFTPTLSNPAGARLNLSVNGPGSWELNGSSYNIAGTVALSGGADLVLNTAADLTIPVLTGASNSRSILVKNGGNTLTLGGGGLLAEVDNGAGQLTVNAGTVIFDKRGANGFAVAAIVGAGSGARISALGSSGVYSGDGLLINGGTVRYAPTANLDQIFDSVDVRINGGTLDFNGRNDAFDSLNGTGGMITNGMAGTTSQVGVGSATSLPGTLNFTARATYGGVIQDGAGQIELIKIGNGVQELTGTNTFTGKTSVAAGLLRISSEANLGANPATFDLSHLILGGGGIETSANVTIDDSNRGVWIERGSPVRPDAGTTLTFATPISGPGGLDMVGRGTTTLSGANLYTGGTSLYRGTLTLDYSSQDNSKLADGSVLMLRGGNLIMSGGTHVENVSATTVDGGGVNTGASYISNAGIRTAAINLNAFTRAIGNGGTLDLGANGNATTDSTNTNGIIASAGAGGFTGTAYATVGKTNWAFNSTNGADGAINGFTAYSPGVHHNAAAGPSSPGTVSTLRLDAAAGSAISGATVLTQQGILMTPNAGVSSIAGTLTGFAAQTAAISSDLAVHQHSLNDLTISAVIADTTAATFLNTTALTKSGAGRLILNNTNTYTGVTYINEGTLELQGTGTAGTGAGAIWIDGTLALNRAGAYSIGNGIGGAATGLILKKDNSAIATMAGGIGTYAGNAVVSQGVLVTTGDAFSNANATNELAANTTVYGTITLGDAGTGATDNVMYFDGRGANHSIRKNIVVANTGSTGLAIIGAGTVTNAATGTGASKGIFNSVHQGTVELNRPTIFRGNSGDRLTFQGSISGNLGGGAGAILTIDAPDIAAVAINTNPGRVSFEATNTFVGDVVVNGAILQVGTGVISDPQDQIPDASNVTLNGVSATKQAGLTLSGDSETINNLSGDLNTFIQSAASSSATQMRLTVNGTGTFNGVFNGTNNTGMTLEKAGSGLFTLGGTADNNTGRVLVTSGTLQLAKLGTGSGVRAVGTDSIIQGGTMLLGGTGGDQIFDGVSLTMYGGTLDLGGTNETVAGIYSNAGVGVITNSGAGASTLTLGGSNISSLLGAVIRDGTSAVALSKTGNGAAVLTGANTYTGATTINGGYIQIGNGGATGSIATTSGVTVAANTQLIFNRDNSSVVSFAPVISGAGGLVQNGTGVLEVPSTTAHTYTGPTVVNSGELNVRGSIVSAVTLNPGATLSGSGTVGAVGSRGGMIKPGNSPGILTTGSVVADIDTAFTFELNGTTAGSLYDQINTTGLIDLDGSLTLSLGYTPAVGDKLFIWLNDGVDPITGTWSGLPEGSTIAAGPDFWVLSYADDITTNPTGLSTMAGNDISIVLVPEPSTSAVTLLGAAALLGRRRRKTLA